MQAQRKTTVNTGSDMLSSDSIESKVAKAKERYEEFKGLNLSLDMSRGKPAAEQLDLSDGLLTCITSGISESGVDCRNYGGLDGIPSARALFSEFLEVPQEALIVGGNSSLWLMHNVISHALSHGFVESPAPWSRMEKVKSLCPVPGYDRHFKICEHYGIEMVPVAMDENGPDMDEVERLLAEDETIRSMWLVPRYGNPTGVTLSDTVVDRLARMETKAADFKIIYDDAYAVHHLVDNPPKLKSIYQSCIDAGNSERVIILGSTSKVTFAGAGVSMIAGGPKFLSWMKNHMQIQHIGPDKINMLRHVTFFKNMDGVREHMKKHAELIRPKFEAVYEAFDAELADSGFATWTKPEGGYFISLDTLGGCAKRVISLAADAGVTLTGAGATFPHGKDPLDRNIRIAPTFPSLDDVRQAMQIVALCVTIACGEKLLSS
jgi:DNA-binding transcriptional MocR family regulator